MEFHPQTLRTTPTHAVPSNIDSLLWPGCNKIGSNDYIKLFLTRSFMKIVDLKKKDLRGLHPPWADKV